MPPRLSATEPEVLPLSHNTSNALTNGAPCPPVATSRERRSDTTVHPVFSAIQAGCPSWRVPFTCAPSTQWNIVCPCEEINSALPPHSSAFARAATAANACPISVSSWQI